MLSIHEQENTTILTVTFGKYRNLWLIAFFLCSSNNKIVLYNFCDKGWRI